MIRHWLFIFAVCCPSLPDAVASSATRRPDHQVVWPQVRVPIIATSSVDVRNITNIPADTHYTSLHLANKWNVPGGSAHYGGEKEVPAHTKCDNCGENHYVPQCTKRRDEVRIKAAVTARRAAAQQRGGQKGYRKSSGGERGGGSKGGTRGGSYRRTTFGTGKWSPPKKGEVARKIDKTVYCACQTCGWTTGSGAHSTGKHDD